MEEGKFIHCGVDPSFVALNMLSWLISSYRGE